MRVYRVLPYLPSAREGEAGHPLYVHKQQGAGRLDNPDAYLVRYVADAGVAAVAEAFGQFELWTPALLQGPPALPGSRMVLAELELGDRVRILDLDDASNLVAWSLRPSRVVTRDRAVTQAWARNIFHSGQYDGARWWSYYNPDWASIGVWGGSDLQTVEVHELVPLRGIYEEARLNLMRGWAG